MLASRGSYGDMLDDMGQGASTAAVKPARSSTKPSEWRDHVWWSADGIRLHARVYDPHDAADEAAIPLFCIPGLTRNARDFDVLAPHLAQHRRVYALDLRGRGDSGYAKDAMTYTPLTYVQDVIALIDELGLSRIILVGTSLGGLVTMILNVMRPGLVAGAVLNDVGPEIEAAGLERIRGYVGQASSFPTWVHCARAVADANVGVFPDWTLQDWLVAVKRSHKLTPEGVIVADYDANIAQPFKVPGGEAGVDLWPAFEALATVPTLIVRGGLSDILAAESVERMMVRLQHGRSVTVPAVGHAPTLDEPSAVAAIDAFVADVPA